MQLNWMTIKRPLVGLYKSNSKTRSYYRENGVLGYQDVRGYLVVVNGYTSVGYSYVLEYLDALGYLDVLG